MFSVLSTVYAEFQNSPILVRLIENMNAYIDPRVNFDNFISQVFDVYTAEGWGLDVLGNIVGVQRVVPVTGVPITFGFDDGVGDFTPFNQAPFSSGESVTSNYALSDTAFRQLILTKAFANICATSSQALNQLITILFGDRGRCYVNDLGNMTMRYTFEFPLQPYEISIIENSGAVPHGTGVKTLALVQPMPGTFGFNGSGGDPFNQGTFLSQRALFDVG